MTTTRIRSVLSAASVAGLTLTALMCLGAPSAHAAELALTDPSGDNQGVGLDILATELANNDYRVNVTIDYRVNRAGSTIVGLKARDRAVVRVVDQHKADGGGRTFLVNSDGDTISCRGLRSDWDKDDVELTLSVPSTCLWNGNYGAVQPWVLTEPLKDGSDIDLLKTRQWIARG